MHIFIGGTGRSGTSILMRCFCTLQAVQMYREPHFICDDNGVFDYITERCSPEQFKKLFRWKFDTKMMPNLARKKKVLPDGVVSDAVFWKNVYSDEYIADLLSRTVLGNDRLVESRNLTDELFLRGMTKTFSQYWVEKTPHTVKRCDLLYAMFPDMRYIHIFRDPLDVFASVRSLNWGPNNPAEFVIWYSDVVTNIICNSKKVPSRNYCSLDLYDLCQSPRDIIAGLFEFSGIGLSADEIEACVSAIDVEKAHIGRYKAELDPVECKLIEKYCMSLYHELRSLATLRTQSV